MSRYACLWVLLVSFTVPARSGEIPRHLERWEKRPRELHLFGDFIERLELAEEIVAAREGQRPFDPDFRRHLLFELSRIPLDELQEMRRTGRIAVRIGTIPKDCRSAPSPHWRCSWPDRN